MPIDHPDSPDTHFVTQALAGDRDAFERLVQRHFGAVWAIAFARLADAHAADDLAQEVLLVAWLHLHSLADPDRFGAWVAQIARNRAADWLRARQRTSKLVTMVPMEELAQALAKTPEPDMDRDEEHELVRRALFDLSVDQREIVLLKFAQGRNQAQIAEQLGVHPATVGRQLDKALASMQAELTPVIESFVRNMRPSRSAIARVALIFAASDAMVGTARAALIDASGATPPAVVKTGTESGTAAVHAAFKSGVGIMGGSKAMGMAVAGIVIGLGVITAITYEQRPARPVPSPAASITIGEPMDFYRATPEQLQAILLARDDCFPSDVELLIVQSATEAAGLIDPDRKLEYRTFTASVDSRDQTWIWFRRDVTGDGTGRAELGTFNPPKVMGVITATGEVLPVQMIPKDGTYMAVAQFKDPWPRTERRTLVLMSGAGPAQRDEHGAYEVGLENFTDTEKIQQIVIVTPPGCRLQSGNQQPTLTREIRGYHIHLWQEHLHENTRMAISAKLIRPTL